MEILGHTGVETPKTVAQREQMLLHQIGARGIKDEKVLQTFRYIPRHVFIPHEMIDEAYQDRPLPIGYSQTISQPYIVALMTEALLLQGDEKVLEVGTGSGYQAAILARMAKEVHTIERLRELSENARQAVEGLGIHNVHFYCGDGSMGLPAQAPFDAIVVTAAAPRVPQALIEQLALNGRLVLPIGNRWQQELTRFTRKNSGIEEEKILPVVFVPLIGEQGWQEDFFD